MTQNADSNHTQIKKVLALANLTTTDIELSSLDTALKAALDVVQELQQMDVTGVEPTTRLSRGVNRWRADVVDREQMLTQSQALSNAQQTYQGYFVVERLIDHEA